MDVEGSKKSQKVGNILYITSAAQQSRQVIRLESWSVTAAINVALGERVIAGQMDRCSLPGGVH